MKKNFIDGFVGKFISNEVRGVLSQLDLLLDTLNEHHKIEPVSIDAFVSRFSDDTDRLIIKLQKSEGIAFVGGHVVVKALQNDPKSFQLGLDLYFTDKDGKVILKGLTQKLPCLLLDERSLADIRAKREIKFEVTEPDQSKGT